MKILLINAPVYRQQRRLAQPLGIAYLGAVLQHAGMNVRLLDANFWKMSPSEIVNLVISGDFHLVGLSVSSPAFRDAIKISQKIKDAKPSTLVIFGGHHATAMHRDIIKNHHTVDLVVRGEGELTLEEIVEPIERSIDRSIDMRLEKVLGITYRKGTKVLVNPPRRTIENLDSLPFPARNLLPTLEQYSAASAFSDPFDGSRKVVGTVLSSRGCPYNCSFCAIPTFRKSSKGRVWRARTPENVVDEIEQLINQYNAEHIQFVDDNFLVSPKRVAGIVREAKKRDIKFSFGFSARSDQIARCSDLLFFLSKNGCVAVEVGIESGSRGVLQRFKKTTSVGINRKALDTLVNIGILPMINFIMFDPETTITELKQNLSFLEKVAAKDYNSSIMYSRLRLYPGTAVYQRMKELRKIRGDIHFPTYDFEHADTKLVYGAVSEFREKCQTQIDELLTEIQEILRMIPRIRESLPRSENLEGMIELSKQCLFESVFLRRIPYVFFKNVLKEVACGDFQNMERLLEVEESKIRRVRNNTENLKTSSERLLSSFVGHEN